MNNGILPEVVSDVKAKVKTFKVGSKMELMTPDYKAIGNRIREARKQAKLNQTELGDILELTQMAISRIENGDVDLTLDNLYMLSQALEQPIEYFLEIGVGDLSAGETEWLRLYRDMPPEVQATLTELVQGYIDRLKRKEL